MTRRDFRLNGGVNRLLTLRGNKSGCPMGTAAETDLVILVVLLVVLSAIGIVWLHFGR